MTHNATQLLIHRPQARSDPDEGDAAGTMSLARQSRQAGGSKGLSVKQLENEAKVYVVGEAIHQ